MRKIKIYLLIGICSLITFIAGLSINEAKANVSPTPSPPPYVNTQTIYVNGRQYIVFTSSAQSMSIIEKY